MKAKAAEFFKKYFLIQDEDMELYEDTIDCMVKFTEQYMRENQKDNKPIKREITCECGKTITVMTNKYGQSYTGKATCECGAVVYIN